jgi:hypothetical protein
MARRHGITANAYKRFVIDTGAVFLNYGEAGEALFGATRGGNTFTVETEYKDMLVDGAKGPVIGSRRITMVSASLTVNMISITADMLKKCFPGSAITDFPATVGKTHDSIKRSLQIALGDYITNVALIGEVTGNATYPGVFIVKNALNDGNFEVALSDGEEAVIALTFKAHFDPSTIDTEPWEVRFPTIA